MCVDPTIQKCRKRVFVVGVAFGAVLAFIFHKTDHASVIKGSCHPPNTNLHNAKQSTYEEWFVEKGVTREFVDYDTLVYGSQGNITEAHFLAKEVSITCAVFVRSIKNAEGIKSTWGQHCNNLVFFGVKQNDSIPIVNFQPKNSFHLLCDFINYILKKFNSLQWILFVHDDMFVIPENLRHFVAPFNYNVPHYLGHAQVFWGQVYNVGEAGYVLSKATLLVLHSKFNTTAKCAEGGKYWKNEDFYLGKHLASMGIVPRDTRDAMGRSRFHGYTLDQLLFPGQLWRITSNWKRSVYPYIEGFGCCSDKTVTFRGIEAGKLHLIHYVLHHVKVFRTPGLLGNKPAPTPMPEVRVWQSFLKAEGKENVSVTAEEYFQLWSNKILGPKVFNERLRQQELGPVEATAVGFANMPHVLESMLSAVHANESDNL